MAVAGVLVLVVVVALVGGGIALAVWAARRTREKTEAKVRGMAALAAAAGWTYWGTSPQLVDAWPTTPFHTGQGRRVENCVEGTHRGVPFLAFEYTYHTEHHSTDGDGHSQTSRRYHHFDVAVLRLGANVPDLSLTPEGTMSRIVDAFTGRDLDLGWPPFDKAFRLVCNDPAFAAAVFTPATQQYLTARPQSRFALAAGDVVLYQQSAGYDPSIWGPGDPAFPVDRSPAPLDLALTVLRGIPEELWQQRGGRPSALAAATW